MHKFVQRCMFLLKILTVPFLMTFFITMGYSALFDTRAESLRTNMLYKQTITIKEIYGTIKYLKRNKTLVLDIDNNLVYIIHKPTTILHIGDKVIGRMSAVKSNGKMYYVLWEYHTSDIYNMTEKYKF